MTLQTICSVDLAALSKRDLKALCQAARDEWGQPIDLRSGAAAMVKYLEAYKQWKLDQENEIFTTVTDAPAIEFEVVELPADNDPDFNATNEEFYFGEGADTENAAEEGFYCNLPLSTKQLTIENEPTTPASPALVLPF